MRIRYQLSSILIAPGGVEILRLSYGLTGVAFGGCITRMRIRYQPIIPIAPGGVEVLHFGF